MGRQALKYYDKSLVAQYRDAVDAWLESCHSIKLGDMRLTNLKETQKKEELRQEMVGWYFMAEELLLLFDKEEAEKKEKAESSKQGGKARK